MSINTVSGNTSGSSYRTDWENNGGVYGNTDTDSTGSAEKTEQIWNAVFEDKKSSAIDTDSFLALIVAQMTNQDFMNPMDDTQMVTQMVQMNTMQMMQEMAAQTKTSYVMNMIGKNVTAARISVSGELLKETGPVEKVSLVNNEYAIYVNGKRFTLEQIMEIGTSEGLASTEGAQGSEGSSLTEDQIMQRKEYLNSLLGHAVSITVKDEAGSYDVEGVVEKVSTKDGQFRVYVKGEWYSLDDVTEVFGKVGSSGSDEVDEIEPDDKVDEIEPGDKVEDTDPSDEVNPDEKVDPDIDTGETEETEEPEDSDQRVGEAEGVEE